MTAFSDLTPPTSELNEWEGYHFAFALTLAARWGAQQAAAQLAGLWPTPITDRPPTEADGDGIQYVQALVGDGWVLRHWKIAADQNNPWRHTPNWQPPAPPTLKQQALAAMSRASFSSLSDYELIRRALEADS